jgi:SAM-dependent methyltransferase
MHTEVLDWVGQFRTDEDLAVLDIGGRDLNGSTRALFPNANPYHVLDLRPGPNVDVVADAADICAVNPYFKFGTYDLVLCTETFEHAKHWRDIIATAYAILRPGGWLIFTCAGPGRPAHSGIEAVQGLIDNEWYQNVSPEEIREELENQGWIEVETHLRGTDTQGKAVKPEAVAVGPAVPAEVLFSAVLSRTA